MRSKLSQNCYGFDGLVDNSPHYNVTVVPLLSIHSFPMSFDIRYVTSTKVAYFVDL